MNVLHVVHGISRERGGAAYSPPRLALALQELGINVRLLCLELGPVHAWAERIPIIQSPLLGPESLGFSRGFVSALAGMLRAADVVHTHFLWSFPIWYAAWQALSHEVSLVMQPRGALLEEAMQHSLWRKQWALRLLDGRCLARAGAVVASSQAEAIALRRRCVVRRIEVIPNGIDMPDLRSLPDRRSARQTLVSSLGLSRHVRFLLFLGRVHPHKNLSQVIRALSLLDDECHLLVVGPIEGDGARQLTRLANESQSCGRVHVLGPAYNERKWLFYRAADVLVLASQSESFGLSAAEALYCGTPVVASTGTPWACLETYHLGRWVPPTPEAIADAVGGLLACPCSARNCQDYARQHFDWRHVAAKMVQLYREISRPSS